MSTSTNESKHPICQFLKVERCDAALNRLKISNNLFDLTLTGWTVWLDGAKTAASPAERAMTLPAAFPLGSDLILETDRTVSAAAEILVEITSLEIGTVLTGNNISQAAKPSAIHHWKLLQIFARDFSEDVLIQMNEIYARRSAMQPGLAFNLFDQADEWDRWLDQKSETFVPQLMSLLKELSPKVLTLILPVDYAKNPQVKPRLNAFLRLCGELEASPHLQFIVTDSFDSASCLATARQVLESVKPTAWWTPRYWFDFQLKNYYDADQVPSAQVMDTLTNISAEIHALNPQCSVILSGAAPATGSAVNWNKELASRFIESMDAFGFSWIYPGPKGWFEGKPGFELELASGLSGAFNQALRSTILMLDEISPEKSIPLALSPLSYFKMPAVPDSVPYQTESSKQDSFYQAAVVSQLLRFADQICLAAFGPVFGNGGLIRSEAGASWGSAGYHLQKVFLSVEDIILRVKTIRDKELQTFEWAGVPGLIDARAIPYIEVLASRSNDAAKINLIVLNRHNRKRAHVRVNFPEFAEMRPLEAKILRSGKRQFQNTAGKPEAVYCGTVTLRKYKKMDHVNLDLPPQGIISMTLTSRDD